MQHPAFNFQLTVAVALATANAMATDGRYREFVIGERAGGMGGAAIAVARDVDAAFYNPAGLARSESDSLSLSANLYGFEHYSTGGNLGGGRESSAEFVSIPGAMGGVSRLSEEWVAGFGLFAPMMETRHVITVHGGDHSTHLDYDDQTFWVGPSIAWSPAGSRWSVGAGLYAIYRDYTASVNAFKNRNYSINASGDLWTLGFLAGLGAQVDLGDGWSAGATVHSPTVRAWDDGTFSANAAFFGDSGANDGVGVYSTDVEADNHMPFQVAVGFGRTVPGVWGFAVDAIYHASDSYDFMKWKFGDQKLIQSMHLKSVLDVSLGGEYIIAKRYPIRAGFYTAFSSIRVPDDPNSNDFATSDVDMYGFTFSVGRRSELMCVNFGIDYAFGDGHDVGYDDKGSTIRSSCDRDVVLATVSTTYFF